MAFEYFKYDTGYTNTLVARSNTSFAPLFPPYKEIYYDILIPETQPLYLYRESGGTIIENNQSDVDAYLSSSGVTQPPTSDGNVTYGEFTGTTTALSATTVALTTNKVNVSGDTMSGSLFFGKDNTPLSHYGRIGNSTTSGGLKVQGLAGLEFNSPYWFNPQWSAYTGTYLTLGVNGLITLTSAPTGGTSWQNTGGTTGVTATIPQNLNIIVSPTKNVTAGTIEWNISFTNDSNQNAYVALAAIANNVVYPNSIFYTVAKNDSMKLYGSIPISTVVNSGDTLDIRITSSENGTINSSLLRISESGSVGGGSSVWGSITGNINNQTDLQNQFNTKLDKSIYQTYTGTTAPATYALKSQVITGATNGLSKSGYTVVLGGNIPLGITSISGNNGSELELNPGDLTLYAKDKITIANGTTIDIVDSVVRYCNDYSSQFTQYSLVDVNYVTGITSTLITGATNGLSVLDRTVKLGGILNEDTYIDLKANAFRLIAPDYAGTSILRVSNNSAYLYVDLTGGTTWSYVHVTENGACVESSSKPDYDCYGGLYTCGSIGLACLVSNGSTEIVRNDIGKLVLSSGGTIFNDLRVLPKGIEYNGDYSTTYSSRSLVDKQYVDSKTSGSTSTSLTGATNGLSVFNRNVKLGGNLSENTNINGNGVDLTLNPENLYLYSKGCMDIMDSNGGGLCIASYGAKESSLYLSGGSGLYKDCRIAPRGIEYSGDYSTTYSNRSLVDKGYVTGLTSTLLPISIFNTYTGTTAPAIYALKSNTITGATNLGSGNGTLYTSVSGNKINLKSISGGTNVTITCNGNYIGINVPSASGIVWTGSTINGVGTYANSGRICSNPNMTFNGNSLSVTGNILASTYICSPIITGSTKICSPLIIATTNLCSIGTSTLTGAVTATSTLNVSGNTVLGSTLCLKTPPSGGNVGMPVLFWDSATSCVRALQLTGGTSTYYYGEKTTSTTTVSTTCIMYYSGTPWSFAAGTYSVDYSAIFGNTGTNGCTFVKFGIDNVAQGKDIMLRMSSTAVAMTASLSRDVSLTSGCHCFTIHYWSGSGTACINFGSIRVKRIC